jgi:hypothetical protein
MTPLSWLLVAGYITNSNNHSQTINNKQTAFHLKKKNPKYCNENFNTAEKLNSRQRIIHRSPETHQNIATFMGIRSSWWTCSTLPKIMLSKCSIFTCTPDHIRVSNFNLQRRSRL